MIDEPEMPPLGLRYGSNPGGHGGRGPGRGGGGGGPGFPLWYDNPDYDQEAIVRRQVNRRIARSGLPFDEVIRQLNRLIAAIKGWYARNFTIVMIRNAHNFYG